MTKRRLLAVALVATGVAWLVRAMARVGRWYGEGPEEPLSAARELEVIRSTRPTESRDPLVGSGYDHLRCTARDDAYRRCRLEIGHEEWHETETGRRWPALV